jgi:hypothetical protein
MNAMTSSGKRCKMSDKKEDATYGIYHIYHIHHHIQEVVRSTSENHFWLTN